MAGGLEENGLIVGNAYDKYGSNNPLVRRIMAGFDSAMGELVAKAAPASIHEVGCGEGYWVMRWNRQGFSARGSDVSNAIVDFARENAVREGLSPAIFESRSIYELQPGRDGADLVVCTEVLEHLRAPDVGLRSLQRVVDRHLLLSVPREPLWRALNIGRGRYLRALGNTPGHYNHWSKKGFLQLVSQYFDILEVRTPLPWTMVLCQPRSR